MTPRKGLAIVVTVYVVLGVLLVAVRPPWEAPDEVDHVRNVEALADGRLYEIHRDKGLERVQPPLYYTLLAGWQLAWGLEPKTPVARAASDCAQQAFFLKERPRCALVRHDTRADGDDQRRVALLRLPSLLLGVLVILLTARIARRLTSDRWTPVVAAATVASVPSYVFASTTVNNDSLAYGLGALATLLAIVALGRNDGEGRSPWPLAVALGFLVGASVLTKVTLLVLVPGLLLALLLPARSRKEAGRLALVLCAVALVVSGPWLVRNTTLYGDPLAKRAAEDYSRTEIPFEFSSDSTLKRTFVTRPRGVWRDFWYRWQQFQWAWWVYVPFWGLALAGLLGLVRSPRRSPPRPFFSRAVGVLGVLSVGALAAVWVVPGTTSEARLAFIGLPAIACLIALGFERMPVPVPARFALPAIGFVGTLVALRADLIGVYL